MAIATKVACIVPKGAWHNVHPQEEIQFVHITPGPGGAARRP